VSEIRDGKGTIGHALIEEYEKIWGVELPTEYRDFLAENNGGYPYPDGFCIKAIDDESTVDRFLGLDVGPNSNLDNYVRVYKDRIPKELFPIAHDPGGNLVCIGISGEHLGRIYFWDHEYEADESNVDFSNVHLVAETLEGFLANLYELEID
jgi:hypothetical protein